MINFVYFKMIIGSNISLFQVISMKLIQNAKMKRIIIYNYIIEFNNTSLTQKTKYLIFKLSYLRFQLYSFIIKRS